MREHDLVQQLKDLSALHAAGALDSEEFARAKARILQTMTTGESGARVTSTHPLADGLAAARRDETIGVNDLGTAAEPTVPSTRTPAESETERVGRARGDPVGEASGHGTSGELGRQLASYTLPAFCSPRAAALTTAISGALIFFAFLALPLMTVPVFGSVTAAAVAAHASSADGSGSLALLWLIPISAGVVSGLGARNALFARISRAGRQKSAVASLILSLLIFLLYLIALIELSSQLSQSGLNLFGVSASSLLGAGFWLTLLSAAAAAVGAGVELALLRQTGQPVAAPVAESLDTTRPVGSAVSTPVVQPRQEAVQPKQKEDQQVASDKAGVGPSWQQAVTQLKVLSAGLTVRDRVIGVAVIVAVAIILILAIVTLSPQSATSTSGAVATTNPTPTLQATATASDSTPQAEAMPTVPAMSPEATQAPATPAVALSQEVSADRPRAEALVGYWVPQISAKKVGLVADGIVYDFPAILADYQQLKAQYPDALLLWSGDYSTFTYSDFYVTVIDEPYTSGQAALGWCQEHNLDNDHCFAKEISHTASAQNSTLHPN